MSDEQPPDAEDKGRGQRAAGRVDGLNSIEKVYNEEVADDETPPLATRAKSTFADLADKWCAVDDAEPVSGRIEDARIVSARQVPKDGRRPRRLLPGDRVVEFDVETDTDEDVTAYLSWPHDRAAADLDDLLAWHDLTGENLSALRGREVNLCRMREGHYWIHLPAMEPFPAGVRYRVKRFKRERKLCVWSPNRDKNGGRWCYRDTPLWVSLCMMVPMLALAAIAAASAATGDARVGAVALAGGVAALLMVTAGPFAAWELWSRLSGRYESAE